MGMEVEIDYQRIRIGDQGLVYYPYYFDIWGEKEADKLNVLKSVLSQWASALKELRDGDAPLYLPYSLDDETVNCIKATRKGKNIILRCVVVGANGYQLDLDDLASFMRSEQVVEEESPEIFGEYAANEIIKALQEARPIDA
jgi:hypothetical protein